MNTDSQAHYALWYWHTYKKILTSKSFAINVIKKMKWF